MDPVSASRVGHTSSDQTADVDVVVGKPVIRAECRQSWSAGSCLRGPKRDADTGSAYDAAYAYFRPCADCLSRFKHPRFAATAARATPIDPARLVASIYADGR